MNILRRLRRWFIEKYLPAYVKEVYREDIATLQNKIIALYQALDKEKAYSAGLEYACKRRININIEKQKGG